MRSIVHASALASVVGLAISCHAAEQVYSWNVGSGNWGTSTNWNPATVPNGTNHSAVIDRAGSYTVTLNMNATVYRLTVLNPTGLLKTNSGTTLHVRDLGIDNDSTITLNRTATNATTAMIIDVDSDLHGNGTLVLNADLANYNSAYLQAASGVIVTHGPNHTIKGSGNLYGEWINQGTIAGGPGNGVVVLDIVTQEGNGRLFAEGASDSVSLSGAQIIGGTTETLNGLIRVIGSSSVDGVTNKGAFTLDNNTTLTLKTGGLVNDGVLTVNTSAGTSATIVYFDRDVTLGGTGKLVLNANINNNDTAYINVRDGFTGTNGAGHTITGSGFIYGQLRNLGTILGGANYGPTVRGTVTQQGTGTVIADGVDNSVSISTNGTIAGGTLQTINGGRIRTVTGQRTSGVSGVTNLGTIQIENNSTLVLKSGGMVNNGQIIVNPVAGTSATYLYFDTNATLGGNGTLVLNANLSNYDTAYIDARTGFFGVNGPLHTITGTGNIYEGLINQGTILGGPGYGPMIRGTLTQQGAGRLLSTASNLPVTLRDGTVVGGSMETTGTGVIQTTPAVIANVNGATNKGTFHITNNSPLYIKADGLVNNGTVVVNPTAGPNNTYLYFDTTATIGGTGTILLNANSGDMYSAYIASRAAFTGTIGAGQTIRGRGRIAGDLINQGTIAGGLDTGVRIIGNVTQTGTGRIFAADADNNVSLENGTLNGGTIQTAAGGRLRTIPGDFDCRIGGGIVNTGTVHIDNNSQLDLITGGLVNNGVIVVNPTAGPSGTSLNFQEQVALGGTGTLLLNASPTDLATAYITTREAAVKGTLGTGQTVAGLGRFYNSHTILGTLAPGGHDGGQFGRFEFMTDVTLAGTATTDLQIGGKATTAFDRFVLAGSSLKLGGKLKVSLAGGFVPAASDTFSIVTRTNGTISGEFATFDFPPAPTDRRWAVSYTPTLVQLYFTCSADFNRDGFLTFEDFDAFVAAFEAGEADSDFNGDGFLTYEDFDAFVAAFTSSC